MLNGVVASKVMGGYLQVFVLDFESVVGLQQLLVGDPLLLVLGVDVGLLGLQPFKKFLRVDLVTKVMKIFFVTSTTTK
jgi:hypothetical protein